MSQVEKWILYRPMHNPKHNVMIFWHMLSMCLCSGFIETRLWKRRRTIVCSFLNKKWQNSLIARPNLLTTPWAVASAFKGGFCSSVGTDERNLVTCAEQSKNNILWIQSAKHSERYDCSNKTIFGCVDDFVARTIDGHTKEQLKWVFFAISVRSSTLWG